MAVVAGTAGTRDREAVTFLFRVRNWDHEASVYIDSILGQPFQYGKTDCASIAAGVLRAMYGPSFFTMPKYKGPKGALAALRKHGIEHSLRDLGAVTVHRPKRYDFAIVHDIDGFPEGVSVVMANRTRLVTRVDGVVERIPYDQGAPVHCLLRMPDYV